MKDRVIRISSLAYNLARDAAKKEGRKIKTQVERMIVSAAAKTVAGAPQK